MASGSRSTVNWELYEDEIRSLFEDKKWTCRAVKEYMEKTYGFKATERMYKSHFPRRKNLTKEEWIWALQTAEERRLEDAKDSAIYFQGRHLDPDRVKRERTRHRPKLRDVLSFRAKPIPCRVEVKTPPPNSGASGVESAGPFLGLNAHQSANNPNARSQAELHTATLGSNPMRSDDYLNIGHLNETPMNAFDGDIFDTQTPSVMAQSLDIMHHNSFTGFQWMGNPSEFVSTSSMTAVASPELQGTRNVYPAARGSTLALMSPLERSGLMHAEAIGHDAREDITMLVNLPWLQHLTHLDLQGRGSSWLLPSQLGQNALSLGRTMDHWGMATTALDYLDPVIVTPRNDPVKGIVKFLDRSGGQMPRWYEEQLSTKMADILGSSPHDPVERLFEFTAYYASNNILSKVQLDKFLRQVIRDGQSERLQNFLQMKTPTTEAFIDRVAEAAIRVQDRAFLLWLVDSGINLAQYLTLFSRGVYPQGWTGGVEFTKEFLRRTPRSLLVRQSGRLLIRLAAEGAIDIAQIFLEHGANLNVVEWTPWGQSALIVAVRSGRHDMVQLLLEYGADPNLEASDVWYSRTALGVALTTYAPKFAIVESLLEHGAIFPWPGKTLDEASDWLLREIKPSLEIFCKLVKGHDLGSLPDLIRAAQTGATTVQRYLQDQSLESKNLALMALVRVVSDGDILATKSLLDNGVDPNGFALGTRPLLQAIRALDPYPLCKLLVDAGADVNNAEILDAAAAADSFVVLRFLVESGADVEEHGTDALVQACLVKNLASVALLLDNGVDINRPSGKHHFNSLQASVYLHLPPYSFSADHRPSVCLAEYLIYRGADVNAPAWHNRGLTALQIACKQQDEKVVHQLLWYGADINTPPASSGGYSALEAACVDEQPIYPSTPYMHCRADEALFLRLIEKGAIVPRSKRRRHRLLCEVIRHGWYSALREVLPRAGTIPHLHQDADPSGHEPDSAEQSMSEEEAYCLRQPSLVKIAVSVQEVNWDILELLVKHGEDVNASPARKRGRTPLQAATEHEDHSVKLVEYLLEHGADIHADPAPEGGITALQGAAITGNLKLALLFLDKGADVNAKPSPKDGRYAIEGAAEHGRLDMVQLLLNAGAKGDVHNGRGFERAIELAEDERHFGVANLLRRTAERTRFSEGVAGF